MSAPRPTIRPRLEHLDPRPALGVKEAEYRRLLGYPPHHAPGERADELAAWARCWFAEHGRPWVYLREVELQVDADRLLIDGMDFRSPRLHAHLQSAGAERAMLVAVSAGQACEAHAGRLWQDGKPDEYFFLEMFGSAVVELLVATLSARICELAEQDGLMAVAHYSPGYTGWDIADQGRLFELIARGRTQPWPEELEVMSSGMLRPKKSLLAVVGLTARTGPASANPQLVPCEACAFAPCQYRRNGSASRRGSEARLRRPSALMARPVRTRAGPWRLTTRSRSAAPRPATSSRTRTAAPWPGTTATPTCAPT